MWYLQTAVIFVNNVSFYVNVFHIVLNIFPVYNLLLLSFPNWEITGISGSNDLNNEKLWAMCFEREYVSLYLNNRIKCVKDKIFSIK